MPVPVTNRELIDLIAKSGVLDDTRVQGYLEKLEQARELPGDPNDLGERMIRDGLLTAFQAEQLLQGRWKRFFIGKYKVLERLGVGGMGQVFLCEHKLMKRKVALKVLPVAKAKDEAALQRFYREARAVASVDHPNIARAYDIDQDGDLHFLVMEFVDGVNLHDLVKRAGPLAWLRAAHYIYGAAVGLQHAHEMGLVHRDIKPANILVDRSGVVKLLDMGLARFFNPEEDDHLTKKYDENILGTADYLAPEQALDSSTADIRADIYGLGGTLFYLLAGQAMFPEGSVAQKLLWHQTRPAPSLTQFRTDVPPEVATILETMLAKNPEHRFQTPAELMYALAPWIQIPIAPPNEEELPKLSMALSNRSGSGSGAPLQVTAASQARIVQPPRTTEVPKLAPTQATSKAVATPQPRPVTTQHSPQPIAPLPAPASKTTPEPARKPSLPALPTLPTALSHGFGAKSGTVPILPAKPVAPPVVETSVWESMAASTGAAGPTDDVPSNPFQLGPAFTDDEPDTANAPRTRRTNKVAQRKSTGLNRRRSPALLIGIVVAGLVLMAGLITVCVLLFKKPAEETTSTEAQQSAILPGRTFHITSKGVSTPDPLQTLRSLADIRGGLKSGDTIFVYDDTLEFGSIAFAKVKNVRLEAANASKLVKWTYKPGSSRAAAITIVNAEQISIKGFDIDVAGVPDSAVICTEQCRDVVLELITIRNAKTTGFRIANAKAEAEHPLRFVNCRVVASETLQTGFNVSSAEALEIIDCRIEGTGSGQAMSFDGTVSEAVVRNNRLYQFEFGVRVPSVKDQKPFALKLEQNTFHSMNASALKVDAALGGDQKITVAKNYFVACGDVASVKAEGTGISFQENGRQVSTKAGVARSGVEEVRVAPPLGTNTDGSDDQFLRAKTKALVGVTAVGAD